MFLDSTGIGIYDANAPWVPLGGGQLIDGNYSIFLEAGSQLGPDVISANATLSQTGFVPLGTRSLSFLAVTGGPFEVSLGGAALNLVSSPVAGQRYSLFQADVSAFAGQTVELDFTLFAANPYDNNIRGLILDDIQFSPNAIPEPSSLGLLALGIAVLGAWLLIRRKSEMQQKPN
jgi:hypothetical protein